MKKGCFIKSIVILTILTAVILYIIKYKFNDFVIKPGKQMLSGVIVDEWAKEIERVKDSPQKDSLKVIVNDLLNSLKNKETVFDDRVKSIMMTISTSVEDSIIESRELNFISEKIKTELQNERSTQN